MAGMLKVLEEAALFRFRPKVSHLILHVTNICNFRCNHCFVEFAKKPIDLTLEEVDQVAGVYSDLIWLDIGGGEPFIRDDLDEIVSKFKAQEISIPTNGWFTDKILKTLTGIEKSIGLDRLILTISIDGLPETHDEIRLKKGSFSKLTESYRAVHQRFPNLRIKINTVLNQRNRDEIIPLMTMIKDEFSPSFHSILFLRGDTINPDYCLPPTGEIRSLEDEIFEIQQGYMYGRKGIMSNVQRHYQSIKREIAEQTLEQETQVIPCLGGQAHHVVYANGDVAPCELLPPVGSLRQEPLRDILAGPEWAAAVGRIKAKECHCTHDCNMVENVLFNFKLYPNLLMGGKVTSPKKNTN
jgi:MoaA/NifB/PqqE/SkfB family radical SAM enzyme